MIIFGGPCICRTLICFVYLILISVVNKFLNCYHDIPPIWISNGTQLPNRRNMASIFILPRLRLSTQKQHILRNGVASILPNRGVLRMFSLNVQIVKRAPLWNLAFYLHFNIYQKDEIRLFFAKNRVWNVREKSGVKILRRYS